uniref:Uncharacterized protein n=1 Tax=Knipowitschia caucasica TaxID=637954 RepID=A0AAV2L8L3_KNICA
MFANAAAKYGLEDSLETHQKSRGRRETTSVEELFSCQHGCRLEGGWLPWLGKRGGNAWDVDKAMEMPGPLTMTAAEIPSGSVCAAQAGAEDEVCNGIRAVVHLRHVSLEPVEDAGEWGDIDGCVPLTLVVCKTSCD